MSHDGYLLKIVHILGTRRDPIANTLRSQIWFKAATPRDEDALQEYARRRLQGTAHGEHGRGILGSDLYGDYLDWTLQRFPDCLQAGTQTFYKMVQAFGYKRVKEAGGIRFYYVLFNAAEAPL